MPSVQIGPLNLGLFSGPDNTQREGSVTVLRFGPEGLLTEMITLLAVRLWVIALEINLIWSEGPHAE